MTGKPLRQAGATLAAIATLAFIVACVAHETVGHGGTCIAAGGRVILLTSVYFHCAGGGPLVDAAGPLANLAVGVAAWSVLHLRRPPAENWRVFLALAMGFNLLWGAGYFVFSAVTGTGDWAFVIRDLALKPRWLWRWLMGAFGLALYVVFLKRIAGLLPSPTLLVLPYLVAGAVSCCAVLFFNGPTLPALREAAQESFGAAIGLLVLAARKGRRVQSRAGVVVVEHSTAWLLAAVVISLAFFATLGRGYAVAGN